MLFLYTINSYSKEHLAFKGIPLIGEEEIFIEKEKGYKTDFEKTGKELLFGKFLDKECAIGVFRTPKSNNVWIASVMFEKKKSWSSLKKNINQLKKYTKKSMAKVNLLNFLMSHTETNYMR